MTLSQVLFPASLTAAAALGAVELASATGAALPPIVEGVAGGAVPAVAFWFAFKARTEAILDAQAKQVERLEKAVERLGERIDAMQARNYGDR